MDRRWIEVDLVPALARVVGLSDARACRIREAAFAGDVFLRISR
jgi:hypothetical protein